MFSGHGRFFESADAVFITVDITVIPVTGGIDKEVNNNKRNNCFRKIRNDGLAKGQEKKGH